MARDLARRSDASSDADAASVRGDKDAAAAWISLLHSLCELERARMGMLATMDRATLRVSIHGSVNVGPADVRSYESRFATLDPVVSGMDGAAAAGMVWTLSDAAAGLSGPHDEFFSDWLRPQGIGHVIYGVVAIQDQQMTYLAVGRTADSGDYAGADIDLFRSVLPCIQMTFRSSRQTASASAARQAILSLLDELPTGIAVLNRRREPIFVNSYGKKSLDDTDITLPQICTSQRQLAGKTPGERNLPTLSEAVEQCWVRTIPRLSGRRPLSIIVQRLRRDTPDGSDDEPAFVLIVSDPDREIEVDQEGLCHLLGLTPAEGRLAALLARGKHIEIAADHLGISIHTARTHLKRIFGKTNTSSQSDLIRLVLSAPPPIRTA
ncbi:MAG TPA: helix-turn-helix transcriptional regulator [Methylomirabilota bacterium]|nr:helix-turn-helix transcriptional regulator [Methylomirabilota bacterium]